MSFSKHFGSTSSQAYWGKGASGGRPGSPQGLARTDFGTSNTKTPPYWEPALENRGYPFRTWSQDIDVWSAGTELQPELWAPSVVQRLGGAARALAREVPVGELRDGRWSATTGAQETGLSILTRGFARRFGALAIETSTRCIIELPQF